MAKRPAGEASFDFEGARYTMVFDMAAIAHFEDATDMSIIEAVSLLDKSAKKPPKLSMLGALVAAGLNRHHPEITREDAMEMVTDAEVMAALTGSFARSMPADEGAAESAGGTPLPEAA